MGAIERRGKDRRAGHVREFVASGRQRGRVAVARLDDDVQRRRQARPIVRQSRAMDERRREHATDVRSVVRRHRALGELSAVESSARFHDVVTRAGDRDGVAVLFAQSDQDVVWEERGGHQRSDFRSKRPARAGGGELGRRRFDDLHVAAHQHGGGDARSHDGGIARVSRGAVRRRCQGWKRSTRRRVSRARDVERHGRSVETDGIGKADEIDTAPGGARARLATMGGKEIQSQDVIVVLQ